MKRKWISLLCCFFFFYCEVSNKHHPLWSCQIEVRSKGILVVSLIAFVMCERVDKTGHALTYTIVHWKKQNWANYVETNRQSMVEWTNFPVWFLLSVCCFSNHSSRENVHHYLSQYDVCVLVDTLKLITTQKMTGREDFYRKINVACRVVDILNNVYLASLSIY
jgi:hypothetical protein